jgi:hypothetical protein
MASCRQGGAQGPTIERQLRAEGLASLADGASIGVGIGEDEQKRLDRCVTRFALLAPKERLPISEPRLGGNPDARRSEPEQHVPRSHVSRPRDGRLKLALYPRVQEGEEPAHKADMAEVAQRGAGRVACDDEVEAEDPHEPRGLPQVDDRRLTPLPPANLRTGSPDGPANDRLAETRCDPCGARVVGELPDEALASSRAEVDGSVLRRHGPIVVGLPYRLIRSLRGNGGLLSR